MTFKTISDVTPLTIRKFREENSLTQKDFWSAVHVTKFKGCRIESGVTALTDTLRLVILETYGVKDDAVAKARQLVAEAMALLSPGTPETINEAKK